MNSSSANSPLVEKQMVQKGAFSPADKNKPNTVQYTVQSVVVLKVDEKKRA